MYTNQFVVPRADVTPLMLDEMKQGELAFVTIDEGACSLFDPTRLDEARQKIREAKADEEEARQIGMAPAMEKKLHGASKPMHVDSRVADNKRPHSEISAGGLAAVRSCRAPVPVPVPGPASKPCCLRRAGVWSEYGVSGGHG